MVVMARGALALLAASLAILLAGCGGGGASGSDQSPSSGEPAAVEAPEPSRFAKKSIPGDELDTYVDVGQRLEIDWAILAAADLVEGGRDTGGAGGNGDGATDQRAAAIAYSLLANGAPTDYQTALTQRGSGDSSYAQGVLELADRLKSVSAAAEGAGAVGAEGFDVPVEGPVVAGFGRSYGIAHNGVDIEAAIGTPIGAAGDGTVTSAGFTSAFGNYSCVRHDVDPPIEGARNLTTCYGNQSEILVQPGDAVRRGETIGLVGCSGPCLRPHLHLQVRDGSSPTARPVDPTLYFSESLASVPADGRLDES